MFWKVIGDHSPVEFSRAEVQRVFPGRPGDATPISPKRDGIPWSKHLILSINTSFGGKKKKSRIIYIYSALFLRISKQHSLRRTKPSRTNDAKVFFCTKVNIYIEHCLWLSLSHWKFPTEIKLCTHFVFLYWDQPKLVLRISVLLHILNINSLTPSVLHDVKCGIQIINHDNYDDICFDLQHNSCTMEIQLASSAVGLLYFMLNL